MTAHWKTKGLGELCEITTGNSNTVDAVDDGQYAFFDRSKVIKRSNRFLFDGEVLIVPGEGKEFFPRYYCGKFDLHQRAYALLNFNNEINIRFLEYFLILEHKYFERVAVGATAKSLRRRHFEDLEIPLPPLPEQERIVKILDEAFEAIDKAKNNVERNLDKAHIAFESYLEFIFSNPSPTCSRKTLKQISLEFGRGKSKHRPRNDKKLYGGKYPFIQTGDIRNSSHLVTSYSQTYSELGLAQSKLWPKGTVCITIAANIAETAVLGFDACFPDSIIGIKVDPAVANEYFVEYLLQSVKLMLKAKGKGSAQDNINLATFEHEKFCFPELTEQRSIVARLDALSAETKKLESIYQRKLECLEELKKSLLQKAFAGEL